MLIIKQLIILLVKYMDINKLIEKEYLIYLHISSKLQNMKIIENKKKRRKVYDVLQELIEIRIFNRYNQNNPPYHGYHKIEESEYEAINKFFALWKEYIKSNQNEEEQKTDYNNVNNIKNYYLQTMSNFYKKYEYIKKTKIDIVVDDEKITCGELEIDRDDRINKLISLTSMKQTLYMLLRYINYGITAHHCSLPVEVYKTLYNDFNVRCEGFSSPLNSKLIYMKDTNFCTLFKDTDSVFGSLGPFSLENVLANSDKNWTVNPPYMDTVMKMAYDIIAEALNKIDRKDLIIIYLIPKWTDNESYILAKSNDKLIKLIELEDGHYMNCNGNVVMMNNVVNSMFIFGNDKNTISESNIDKLIKKWSSLSDSGEQSKFSKPKMIKL